jgi:outer membrane protein OmpA-like peptidoglycan-associated protein
MFKFLVGFSVFLAWTVWARHVYVCEIKHLCQQSVFVDSTMGRAAVLRISRQGEIIGGSEQFAFDLASDQTELNDGNRDFLRRISKYLQADKNLVVRITGRYTPSERNVPAGMYENLGLSRAALVRDSLVGLYGAEPRRIRIMGELARETDPEAATPPESPLGFWISKDTILTRFPVRYEFTNMAFSAANFKYGKITFTPTLPFVIYADSLKSHLRINPSRIVLIAAYAPTRDQTARNTAQARAEAVKKYLFRTKGIAATMMTTVKIVPANAPPNHALTIQVLEEL